MGANKTGQVAGKQARAEPAHTGLRRSSIGRALVAFAVFAPALIILAVFLLSQGSIYSHRFPGPRWPWILGDVALLLVGIRMMRGEDL